MDFKDNLSIDKIKIAEKILFTDITCKNLYHLPIHASPFLKQNLLKTLCFKKRC
jgi:hypothetical protein